METMYICIAIAALVVLLILTIGMYSYQCGYFEDVTPPYAGRSPLRGETVIAYKFYRGDYFNSGPYFTEVASIAPDNVSLAILYDVPYMGRDSRYAVASVLAEQGKELDQEMVKKFEEKNYKIFRLPEVDHTVNTDFMHYSVMSIFIGGKKAYTEMKRYIVEKKLCAHPFVEIYRDDMIQFMAPLSRQEDFYVPEAEEHELELETEDVGSVDNSCVSDFSESVSESVPESDSVPEPESESVPEPEGDTEDFEVVKLSEVEGETVEEGEREGHLKTE